MLGTSLGLSSLYSHGLLTLPDLPTETLSGTLDVQLQPAGSFGGQRSELGSARVGSHHEAACVNSGEPVLGSANTHHMFTSNQPPSGSACQARSIFPLANHRSSEVTERNRGGKRLRSVSPGSPAPAWYHDRAATTAKFGPVPMTRPRGGGVKAGCSGLPPALPAGPAQAVLISHRGEWQPRPHLTRAACFC